MNIRILYASAVAILALCLSSCSSDNDAFIGSWTASAPISLRTDIPHSSATSLISLDFSNGEGGNRVYLSSLIDLTRPVTFDNPALTDLAGNVSISAVAGVSGTWSRSDDDDDLLLAFDISSLKVDVAPDGVTFNSDMITGNNQSLPDSLTTRIAAICKSQIEGAFRGSLSRFSKLEDVKVDRDRTTLQFEINAAAAERDIDMVMYRKINAD